MAPLDIPCKYQYDKPMLKRLFLPLLFSISLYSKEPLQEKAESYDPIFAGTLLAYFSENIAPGQCLFEPYIFVGTVNGTYTSSWKAKHSFNNFALQTLWLIETGITSWLDIGIITFENYTSAHGKKSYHNGDTHLSLGFQISKNEPHSWVPDFRLVLQETFPTGKYQNLNPKKNLGDVTGSGAYKTWLISVTRKIIYLTPRNPITVNLTLGCNFPTSVHAKNYNLYGGAPKTSASVKPGQQLLANLAFEYSLTLNWILGLDIHYLHQNKSRSSHPLYGLPSSEQLSLAPCIEYNPSTNIAFELGS
jgi:hypothetical protein